MLENLITDRTAADVAAFIRLRDKGWDNMTTAEREQWTAGMKGAYNASDLNRVCSALNYMRDILTETGYLSGREFSLKTNWTTGEVITADFFNSYINAVETVRGALVHFDTTPQTPVNVGSLDYKDANNIEKILIDMYDIYQLMMQTKNIYCGDIYGGEI